MSNLSKKLNVELFGVILPEDMVAKIVIRHEESMAEHLRHEAILVLDLAEMTWIDIQDAITVAYTPTMSPSIRARAAWNVIAWLSVFEVEGVEDLVVDYDYLYEVLESNQQALFLYTKLISKEVSNIVYSKLMGSEYADKYRMFCEDMVLAEKFV